MSEVKLFRQTHLLASTDSNAGLYIHIPFCLSKCPYCDFYSETDLSRCDDYVLALASEMTLTQGVAPSFDTIYLGGGTPSLLSGKAVETIISTATAKYTILPGAEITMEVNPGTVNARNLHLYRRAGVNRISVGVQSFDNRFLKRLGRIHTAEAAVQCLREVERAGFKNVGIDLIYGITGQDPSDWHKDLATAQRHRPSHISCYMLSFEPETPFEAKRQAGSLKPLDDATIAQMYRMTVSELADGGYQQYEVSNFALPGDLSNHNTKYWNGSLYLGLGAGAHSFDGRTRSWNYRNIDTYIQTLAEGVIPLAGKECLRKNQQMVEAIYLGLRTTAGIRIDDFNRRFGVDLRQLGGDILDDFEKQRFIHQKKGSIALTVSGMLLLDSIVGQISDQIEK